MIARDGPSRGRARSSRVVIFTFAALARDRRDRECPPPSRSPASSVAASAKRAAWRRRARADRARATCGVWTARSALASAGSRRRRPCASDAVDRVGDRERRHRGAASRVAAASTRRTRSARSRRGAPRRGRGPTRPTRRAPSSPESHALLARRAAAHDAGARERGLAAERGRDAGAIFVAARRPRRRGRERPRGRAARRARGRARPRDGRGPSRLRPRTGWRLPPRSAPARVAWKDGSRAAGRIDAAPPGGAGASRVRIGIGYDVHPVRPQPRARHRRGADRGHVGASGPQRRRRAPPRDRRRMPRCRRARRPRRALPRLRPDVARRALRRAPRAHPRVGPREGPRRPATSTRRSSPSVRGSRRIRAGDAASASPS